MIATEDRLQHLIGCVNYCKRRMLGKKPTYYTYGYLLKVEISEYIVDNNLSIKAASKIFSLSPSTIRKWVKNYRMLLEFRKSLNTDRSTH